jgi:hypothetical protein
MATRKGTKGQTMIYKTLNRRLQIRQYEIQTFLNGLFLSYCAKCQKNIFLLAIYTFDIKCGWHGNKIKYVVKFHNL